MVSASGDWDWPRISPLLPQEVLDQIAAIQPPQGWLDSDTPGLTLHDRNLTNAERFRRHLTSSALCDICGGAMEDMDHILRHCRAARGLWRRVLQPDFLSDFLHMPFDEWLRNNISRSIDFLGSDYNPKDDILFRGNRLVDECIQGAANKFQVSHHEQPPTPHWCLPIPGWVKGNVDAFVHTSTGQAAIDGLLRDDCGDWVVSFTRPVGRCSVLVAELWALHDMLHCAWDRGFPKVLIESDCLEVIRILQQTSPSLSSTSLVASILRLTEYGWELVIRHVPREGNALADRLSKWGRIHSPETVILVHPPSTLNALVNAEKGSGLRDPLLVQDWLRDATAACFNLRADPDG
ncbi:hypothetical protein V6N12_075025 [Hibiscus sabdariffa]|uniref:RNase H type-1 domain-containing protein n=1 Tax=Hibiscus sabdariffa TaxID=183260 RepID=A0ABR2BZ98_9ROSI